MNKISPAMKQMKDAAYNDNLNRTRVRGAQFKTADALVARGLGRVYSCAQVNGYWFELNKETGE